MNQHWSRFWAVLVVAFYSQYLLADALKNGSSLPSVGASPAVSTVSFSSMLTDDELAWLVANPEVNVGVDPYFHPIEFFDENGRYMGLSADYLALVSQRTGITFNIERRDSWQQVVDDVKEGIIDMMAANVPSGENTSYLNFTENYFSFPNVLVTTDNGLVNAISLSEFSGRKVAVVAGYPDEDYLATRYPDIERIRVDSVVKGLETVTNKQADALLSFLPTVSYFMELEGFVGLQITSVRVRFGGAFAVKKAWPELISILDKALLTISDREHNEIVQRWVTFQNAVGTINLTEDEIAWLEGIEEVRLGIDNEWAPFEYRDALGEYKGISSDYMSDIEKWLEIPFDAGPAIPWGKVLEQIEKRELDVLPAIVKTPSREQYLAFTKPYMTFPIVLMTSIDTPLVSSVADFADGTIAVVKNYAASELMQLDYPDYNFIFVESVEEGVQKLSLGEIDGFISNMASITYAMQSLSITNIKIATTTGRDLALSMGVRKDWLPMVPILQKALDRYTKAQKQNIYNSWINVRVETRSDWAFIIKVSSAIGGVLLVILVIVTWKNKQLAREVEERKRITEDLKLLTLAVEQSPVSVLITDPKGDIIYVNPTCEAVAGYRKTELIGQNPRVMKSPKNDKNLFEDLWQVITLGQTWHGEYFNCRPDGSEYLVDSTIVPIRLPNGNISHYLEIKIDVTQQRKDENRLRTFEKFVENSNQGLGMASLDGEFSFVNEALSRMLGENSPDAALGKQISSYYKGDVGQKLSTEVMPALISKGAWSGQLALTTNTGKTTQTLESFFVIKHEDGTPKYLADVITDISEQKKAQEELKIARQKAEHATMIKSEFLAKMSHEIRTPMNAIIGMSHLALRTELNDQQRDYITKSYQAAQSLLSLVNDILDFSKIESGKLELESIDFDLEEVFNNLSNLCVPKASEKGLEVIFSIDPSVPQTLIGDPLRIGQVLLNLTTNAIKFTQSGQIFVEVQSLHDHCDAQELLFTVSDTGIGLTQKQMDRLFQSFQQADNSTTREYGGTGLGLSICKNLVELMGGHITVSSVKGLGSRFQFSVLVERTEKSAVKAFAVPSQLANMNVMVVDDNATAREVMSTYLTDMNFEVDTFADGEQALNTLSSNPQHYKVIFLDWMMPGMSGLEVAEKIKSSYSQEDCPKIVMVTSHGREDVINAAQQLGLDGFLIKPVNQSMLFDAIVSSVDGSLVPSSVSSRFNHENLATEMLKGKTILLVEDNEINQQIGQELIENMGAKVDVADNGAVALEMVNRGYHNSERYDAILMDLRMPVMDGLEATKHLRKKYSLETLPIIFMTADAMKGVQETVLAAGANDYIAKPIEPDLLREILNRIILQNLTSSTDVLSSSPKSLEELQWLDYASAIKRLSGNHSLYQDLLKKFVEQFSDVNDQITLAMQAVQWDVLSIVTHTLKGVSANIGADKLHELAKQLEQAANTSDKPSMQQHLIDLPSTLTSTLSVVHRWIEENNLKKDDYDGDDLRQLYDSKIEQLLASLEQACIANKGKVAKDIAKELVSVDLPDTKKQDVKEVVATVNRYRLKEASQLIARIRTR